jgi:hypothetical protein
MSSRLIVFTALGVAAAFSVWMITVGYRAAR